MTRFFLATCLDCEPILPQPFHDETVRDAWAEAHREGTAWTGKKHTVTTSQEDR